MPQELFARPSRDSPDLMLVLRPDSAIPLRGQLRDAIRDAIRTGRLPAGARLPSSRALAADFGVSRGVVVDAYAQLTAEGYLTGQSGSGTRVAETFQVPRTEPVPAESPASAPRELVEFDLRADRPDPALFPRRKWISATRGAVHELADGELGYPDPLGDGRLRFELASYLGRVRGAVATPETVLVVAGVTQGLALLVRLLGQLGHETLAVENPGSRLMERVAAGSGVRLVPVPVDREGLDVSALATTRARAVLCAPAHHFPTGAVMSSARRSALVRWAMDRDGVIIEDDHDGVFRWDRMPMGCLQGLDPQRVALVGSVSHSLAPGLRLGWLVPPAPLLASLVTAKRDADGGSPVIEQRAFAHLIEMGAFDRHLRRARKIYRARRAAFLEAVAEELPGWSVAGAVAGLHVWLRPPARIDGAALVGAAAARGVAIEATVTPGAPQDWLAGLAVSYARMDIDHASEVVKRIAEAVQDIGFT